MAANKDSKIQIRLKSDTKKDLKKLADFRGLTPTAIIHSLIVKTIYEAKMQTPAIFEDVETHPPKKSEKFSDKITVNARAKNKDKSKKPKGTLKTRAGEIPLVEETSFDDEPDDQ